MTGASGSIDKGECRGRKTRREEEVMGNIPVSRTV